MDIYDIQLEQTGTAPDWTLFTLCALAGVLGLIAAVVVVPQLLRAMRGARPAPARHSGGPGQTGQAAAGHRVGLAMATVLAVLLVTGGTIGSVVALTATGLHHASGHVEATGVVDGQRWLKLAELPFPVAWDGAVLEDGDRVGAACTEGSAAEGLDWTCAPPGR